MREPSKNQLEAIKHLSGPAQIIAGPGSGKTFTIIQRIKYLIFHYKVAPESILIITYTRAAACEMQERFEKEAIEGHVCFGTFHSICYQILKQVGASTEKNIIRETEKRKILKTILENHDLSEKSGYDYLSELINSFSKQKNLMVKNEFSPFLLSEFSLEQLLYIQNEYLHMLGQENLIDFDDMLIDCLRLLRDCVDVREKYQSVFRYLMVDEFQDINPPQYEILKLLVDKQQNLFVVGDDDQAIYGFRGATPGIMQQFPKDYPTAKQIFLSENFRCKDNIVHLSNQIISDNIHRFKKDFVSIKNGGEVKLMGFHTRKEEEEQIINALKESSEAKLEETVIILRTNLEVAQYAELLRQNNIGLHEKIRDETQWRNSFMAEDILAFFTFLLEKKRADFLVFMNKPNHYFSRLSLPSDIVTEQTMLRYYDKNPKMQSEVKRIFKNLELASKLSPYLAISLFRKTMGYDSFLKQKAKNMQQQTYWIAQINEIQELLKQHKFIQQAVSFFHETDSGGRSAFQKENKGVHVITMHGAKGLEFNTVILPDLNEGILPGRKCITKEEIEEERRLLYVAITRARDTVYIYYTGERNRQPSRFLRSIIRFHLK